MDAVKLLLGAGAAYLVYNYLNGSASSTVSGSSSSSATAPTITGVSGALVGGADSTLTVTLANVQGSPAFYFNTVQVHASLGSTPNQYTVVIPAFLLIGGNTGALGVSASNGKAAVSINVARPVVGTTPQEPLTPIVTGAVLGHSYTTKASFLAALTAALTDVAGSGAQSIDALNWYLVNQVNGAYLVGGVGPDPDAVAVKAGIDRNATLTPGPYVAALDAGGFVVYPAGLSGLRGLARGINEVNKHPFAGRNIAGKVVIQ